MSPGRSAFGRTNLFVAILARILFETRERPSIAPEVFRKSLRFIVRSFPAGCSEENHDERQRAESYGRDQQRVSANDRLDHERKDQKQTNSRDDQPIGS